jgi:hypothetical protein
MIILFKSLCKAFMHERGITKDLMGKRLMTFGVDGAIDFNL